MLDVLKKLASRKLWVTLLTLAAVILGAGKTDGVDPDQVQLIVMSAMGGLYVLVQGLVDRVKEQAVAKVQAAANTLSPEVLTAIERFVTLAVKAAQAPPRDIVDTVTPTTRSPAGATSA
jgi:hypothetical protein